MIVKTLDRFFFWPVLALLLFGATTRAATVTGTVTNATNGKPSAGDNVVLIDVQAGMAETASATTDAHGHYSMQSPGMGTYLVRVNHQGGTYFIAAPQGGGPGDVTVYDVAPKVDGVAIDADMLLVEAGGDMLRVHERYMVRNTSLPPKAQFSSDTFEIALPNGAELDGAAATRPGGLATTTRLVPVGQSGHYTFNIPIQPDKGEKETVFEVQYHIPYSGKFTFTPHLQMPADNLVVYVPSGMTFAAAQGAAFQSRQEDPRVQTFAAKNIGSGQAISFTISGQGQMPPDTQGGGMQAGGGMADGGVGGRPGGGLGVPIDTPDPLSKYKWWILGAMTLLLVAGAGYLLRNRGAAVTAGVGAQVHDAVLESRPLRPFSRSHAPAEPEIPARTGGQGTVLGLIKDELFAIESEKLSGELSEKEYAEVKAGLQAVLKRALRPKQKTGT
ncbi:MAG: carboxypeptidase-like regulatory domain-containing protein [Acidobacteriota bacterium]|nr:carboxypeptidase-like regulatory domain-containing protein [Acidobacteriota bacterium]